MALGKEKGSPGHGVTSASGFKGVWWERRQALLPYQQVGRPRPMALWIMNLWKANPLRAHTDRVDINSFQGTVKTVPMVPEWVGTVLNPILGATMPCY